MASDNERREVARRLRRVADKYDGVACMIVEGHLGIECDERLIGGSVYTSESVKRLADLIEPSPSCEFWDSEEKECYSVHTVRTCRIAEEVDEVETELGPIEVRTYLCGECHGRMMPDDAYCPNCGAKVVGE